MKAGIFDFEYSVCHFIFHRMFIEDIWVKNTHYCDHGNRGQIIQLAAKFHTKHAKYVI